MAIRITIICRWHRIFVVIKEFRPIPQSSGYQKIRIDGTFKEWDKVKVEYRDTKGDVTHRDHKGYGGNHYVNNSGRNDIVLSKVAVDKDNIFFMRKRWINCPHFLIRTGCYYLSMRIIMLRPAGTVMDFIVNKRLLMRSRQN